MASGCPAPLFPPVPLPAGAGPVLGRRRRDRPSKAGRIRARPARAEPQSAQTRADDHPGRGVNVRAAVDDHSSTDHPGFERSRDRVPIVCRPRAEPSSYACRRTASTMAADLGNPRESANPRLTRFYGKTRTGRSARSSPAQSAPCVRARNRQVHKPADANPLAAGGRPPLLQTRWQVRGRLARRYGMRVHVRSSSAGRGGSCHGSTVAGGAGDTADRAPRPRANSR
jgi:hypothetical protein